MAGERRPAGPAQVPAHDERRLAGPAQVPAHDERRLAGPAQVPPHDGGGGTAVEVIDLVKRYPKRDVNAVDGLSFAVREGEVFGLLGPNGAGKTTTVGILTTRIEATSGRAMLAGIDVLRNPVAARARLAVVPQRSNLDRSLTPRQNLTFHAAYHGVGRGERNERAATLLKHFGLEDQADVQVDWYS